MYSFQILGQVLNIHKISLFTDTNLIVRSRFKSLLSKENRKDAEKEEKRERKEEAKGALEKKDKELVLQLSKEVLAAHLAPEDYAIGQTKIFLRLDAQYKLDVAVASQDTPKSGSSFADFKKKMKWLILAHKD